ncbi:MAG: PadR family transcriptional regulator [Alphaproteobacteria bacterium]|nr:PadR family transcriptional regulator [Alphaproteobacteria bacterium]
MFHHHKHTHRHDRRGMRGSLGDRHFSRGHRRGGGRGRPFEHGELRFVLLQLLAETPRHGYELIKAIEEKLGGAYSPSPGVIYPTLTMLEEFGYVTITKEEGGKKLYAVTPEGASVLEANRATVEALFQRMQSARGSFAAPPVVRAMENLKVALKLKLSEPGLDEERLRKIAAAIDVAAIEVERS